MSRSFAVRVLSILAGMMFIVGIGFTPAYADTGQDGFTVLYASSPFSQNITHGCAVLGTDRFGNQAVECVDLDVLPNFDDYGEPNYPYFAAAGVEAYCQNSSGAVIQCANISESVSLENGLGQFHYVSQQCGHSNGSCPPSSRYIDFADAGGTDSNFTYYDSSNCSKYADSNFQVYAVVWGGAGNVIELPQSDMSIALGNGAGANDDGNLSNGHYYACF
jgi:hypothetical protein